jgi:cytochrome bd-type quinol oxidase subunit 1
MVILVLEALAAIAVALWILMAVAWMVQHAPAMFSPLPPQKGAIS